MFLGGPAQQSPALLGLSGWRPSSSGRTGRTAAPQVRLGGGCWGLRAAGGGCSQGRGKERRQSLCPGPGPGLPRRSLARRRWAVVFARKAAATRRLGGQPGPCCACKGGGPWQAATGRVRLRALKLGEPALPSPGAFAARRVRELQLLAGAWRGRETLGCRAGMSRPLQPLRRLGEGHWHQAPPGIRADREAPRLLSGCGVGWELLLKQELHPPDRNAVAASSRGVLFAVRPTAHGSSRAAERLSLGQGEEHGPDTGGWAWVRSTAPTQAALEDATREEMSSECSEVGRQPCCAPGVCGGVRHAGTPQMYMS